MSEKNHGNHYRHLKEIPLSAVLKERHTEAEAKFVVTKEELSNVKVRIQELETDNQERIIFMNRITVVWPLFLIIALMLLTGCSNNLNSPAALSDKNINLIFVSSPDLTYQAPGDIQPDTANLTSQGLSRSLMMATYLKQQVLGRNNVTRIYALSPMTHLQTSNKYPDMTSIGYIQQFALLNQETLPLDTTPNGAVYTANSYPLNVSYPSKGSLPDGVVEQKSGYSVNSSGLDFNNSGGVNDTLVSRIIDNKTAGYYVFSAPWETIRDLLTNTNTRNGYNLNLPSQYMGPNYVYAISIPLSGSAGLVTYNSNLNPPATYPQPPSPVPSAACTHSLQSEFSATRTGGVDGVTVPANSNKNQTIYIVRHAEAHPDTTFKFENGNFVAAGQWRALELHNALRGKISPQVVYSIDPAQWYTSPFSKNDVSYVRPSLTVLPYAIANNLPYYLASSFFIFDERDSLTKAATLAGNFFFTGGKFSNQTVLLAWESQSIMPLIKALLLSYGGSNIPTLPVAWLGDDYNTFWTVKLDAQGNLTVDNNLCEGIDSAKLPDTAPQF